MIYNEKLFGNYVSVNDDLLKAANVAAWPKAWQGPEMPKFDERSRNFYDTFSNGWRAHQWKVALEKYMSGPEISKPIDKNTTESEAEQAKKNKEDHKKLMQIFSLVGIGATSLISAYYGVKYLIKKIPKSIQNLSEGRKTNRSLLRLIGMGLGAIIGTSIGVYVGLNLNFTLIGLQPIVFASILGPLLGLAHAGCYVYLAKFFTVSAEIKRQNREQLSQAVLNKLQLNLNIDIGRAQLMNIFLINKLAIFEKQMGYGKESKIYKYLSALRNKALKEANRECYEQLDYYLRSEYFILSIKQGLNDNERSSKESFDTLFNSSNDPKKEEQAQSAVPPQAVPLQAVPLQYEPYVPQFSAEQAKAPVQAACAGVDEPRLGNRCVIS